MGNGAAAVATAAITLNEDCKKSWWMKIKKKFSLANEIAVSHTQKFLLT